VADNGMRSLAKGILGAPPSPPAPWEPPPAQAHEPPVQGQALQVLNLAQRTAEEHIATARREADKIRMDARAKAEQIVREAQAHADETQHTAEDILADAQARARDMAKDAQAKADDLTLQARQRYEDVVGSLATKREALQRQIEALEHFDHDYRARLTSFMQGQLRALWVDEPIVEGQLPDDAEPAPAGVPAQHGHAERS
jgi:cell division septum initiation protein DivIVA